MTSTTTLSKKAILTSASDDAIVVQAKSKKTPHPTEDDYDVYTTESTDVYDVEVKEKESKKSKTNSIQTKTIDALKNAATAVISMNLFTIHYTQNGVDPTLKTIMDNGAASNELFQLLQPTHNESVKNNDKIEGETLKKLIHHNIKLQLEYLRSILDSSILSLIKMVVPDWLQTDVAIKLRQKKIEDRETRERLKRIISSFEMPQEIGFIYRTASQNTSQEMLVLEANELAATGSTHHMPPSTL
ncbi:hypothetical protein ACTFIW_003297 [Dictyostelium discoideum]